MDIGAIKEKICNNSKKILDELIPKKIIHLTEIIESTDNEEIITILKKNYEGILDGLAFAMKDDFNEVFSTLQNRNALLTFTNTVQKEIESIWYYFDDIQMWIKMNIPHMEDGNNFGVEVQMECITELETCIKSINCIMDIPVKYHEKRGHLMSKYYKNITISDYAITIARLDLSFAQNLRDSLISLRNNLICITNIITKNYVKIIQPKPLISPDFLFH